MMLIEVAIAVAVVALGLTAFASGVPTAAMAVSEGAQLSTATFLAVARLDEARRIAWSGGSGLDSVGLAFPDEAALPDPYAGYAREVRTIDCGEPPGCGGVTAPLLRQVTVTVSYRPLAASGLAARNKSVSLTTLVTRR
jgi:hypothetical protein